MEDLPQFIKEIETGGDNCDTATNGDTVIGTPAYRHEMTFQTNSQVLCIYKSVFDQPRHTGCNQKSWMGQGKSIFEGLR